MWAYVIALVRTSFDSSTPMDTDSRGKERPSGKLSGVADLAIGPKKSVSSSSSLNSRRAVCPMMSRMFLKLVSSEPGTSTMMSSSRVETLASRSPSSSMRRWTMSFAWPTARSRICVSTDSLMRKSNVRPSWLRENARSPRNSSRKRASTLSASAGFFTSRVSFATSVLTAVTSTFSRSFAYVSSVGRPSSPLCRPKIFARETCMSS